MTSANAVRSARNCFFMRVGSVLVRKARESAAALPGCPANCPFAEILLLLVLGRARAGRLLGDDAAERAAQDDVLAGVRRDPLLHLVLELFVREGDAVTKVDEHVRDRAVARALPVARIGDVLV